MQNINIKSLLKDSNTIGVYIYEKEGKVVYANDTAAKIFGYDDRKEFIGKSFLEHIRDKQVDAIKAAIERRLKGEVFPAEYFYVTLKIKGGGYRFVEAFAYTIKFKEKFAGLVIFIDRTKERSLEKLYRSLSEINQLIIKTSSEDELIKRACDVLVDKVGYPLAGIGKINRSNLDVELIYVKHRIEGVGEILDSLSLTVDENKECGKGTLYEAFVNKKVAYRDDVFDDLNLGCWHGYYRKLNVRSVCSIPGIKNGEVKYIFFIADTLRGSFSQESIGLLEEFKEDISYALDNIELERKAKILERAISISHDWALITDSEGTINYANKTVENISGYKLKEIIGKKPSIFKSGHNSKRFYYEMWEKLKKGEIFDGVAINKTKDGSLVYLDKSIVPIIENGKIENFVDISKDITDSVLKNKQLEFQSKIYNTLFHVSHLSITAESEDDFLKRLTSIFVDYMGMDASFVATLSNGKLSVYSKHFKDKRFLEFIEFSTSQFETLIKLGMARFYPLQKSLKKRKVFFMNSVRQFLETKLKDYENDVKNEFLEKTHLYNVKSCASLPVIKGNRAIGSAVILSHKENIFDSNVYRLLNMVVNQIKFSLDRFEKEKFSKMTMTALNSGFEFIVILDDKFNVSYANKRSLSISGYSLDEVLGKHYMLFLDENYDDEFYKTFRKQLEEGIAFSNIMKFKSKRGERRDFFVTVLPFKVDDKITNYIAYGKQITDKTALENRLNKMLNYDSNTGLININYFRKVLNRFLENYKKLGAVAIINPVGFKKINEAYSFSFGDKILKKIAERIKDTVKSIDIVGKLDSDRFGVILKNLNNEFDALVILEQLLEKLSEPYIDEGRIISLSFNAGLSLIPRDGKSANELLRKAMVALSGIGSDSNKKIGFFSKGLEENVVSRLKLKIELEKALNNNDFIMFYQPYVDADGKISGAESLLRWYRNGKIVPPGEFIDYLEQVNLIVDIEKNSLKNVAELIKKIEKEKKRLVPISVNLSKKSLINMDLYGEIKNLIGSYKLDSSHLKIEMVERAFFENFGKINKLICDVNDLGVLFYLDDFGTGYSSLSYISNIPIDVVKIDIYFIRKILVDKKTRSIVDSIIYLAKNLGIKTVAEGVEEEEQFRLLKKMGCDYFQGYLFYRPMPEDEFLKLLS